MIVVSRYDDDLEQEDDFSAVESVKAASDVYMPVSGKVLEVNEDLLDSPELLNSDPFDSWIVKVELTDKAQLDDLMSSEEYEEFTSEEA